MAGPLSHIRVLDLTRVRAGPTAVRQFADWGADVIKIELPEDAFTDAGRDGSDFQNLQRNKRSLSLNLKDPDGVAILKRLAATADVIVENYRPDVKQRLGIAYDDLKPLNPRLVYASVSGYGQDGPYRDRPGLDQIAQGMGGLMAITGHPGEGPVRAGAAVADMAAGLYCAIGIMTALLERERTGEGQWIHTSLLQAEISLLDFQAARWLVEKEIPGQAGNDHPTMSPMGMFATADSHVNIAPFGDDMWRKLCKILEIGVAEDERFVSAKLRLKNRDALNQIVAAAMKRRTSAEWVETLNAAGIPCGPVYRMNEVFADPQVRHLEVAREYPHPRLGPLQLVGQPIQMSRSRALQKSAAPERGEHTDAVLGEVGFSPAEIADFRSRGVV